MPTTRLEIIVVVALALIASSSHAAVIRLHTEHRATKSIVRLGDVADVESADAEEAARLESLELLPAPAAGRTQEVTLRDIQDALARHNLNPVSHLFSGAGRVAVSGPAAARTQTAAFLTTSQTRRAEDRVGQAIGEYLQARVAPGHWDVELELNEAQADAVSSHHEAVSVSGARELPEGRVRFDVVLQSMTGPVGFFVDADVSQAPAVVVATRPIPRGAKVRATDVELQHAAPPRGEKVMFSTVEAVIGMEVTRAIRAGQVLDDRSVQPVVLVRRRDVLTVYSRAGGIEVRTTARAVDDGSLGELIAVESLTNRKSFFARVSGPQTVEVVAQALRTAGTVPAQVHTSTAEQVGAGR